MRKEKVNAWNASHPERQYPPNDVESLGEKLSKL